MGREKQYFWKIVYRVVFTYLIWHRWFPHCENTETLSKSRRREKSALRLSLTLNFEVWPESEMWMPEAEPDRPLLHLLPLRSLCPLRGADAKARSGQQNHFTWREKHLRMNVGKRSQWVRQGSASLEWSAESEWRNLTCVCLEEKCNGNILKLVLMSLWDHYKVRGDALRYFQLYYLVVILLRAQVIKMWALLLSL